MGDVQGQGEGEKEELAGEVERLQGAVERLAALLYCKQKCKI